MLRWFNGLLPMIMAMFLLAGCTAGHTVVLVSDPDGHVGRAEVATAGGSQILEKSGDMTRVSGPSAVPSTVTSADPKYIASTFADVLAIEPLPPEKFILFFETGNTVLTAKSRQSIVDIIQAIKRRKVLSVAVSGHTDSVGSVLINDRLAHDRAEFVRDLLIRSGVNPDNLTVSSHGKGNPLVPTPDGVAEPRNRRVEVIVR